MARYKSNSTKVSDLHPQSHLRQGQDFTFVCDSQVFHIITLGLITGSVNLKLLTW